MEGRGDLQQHRALGPLRLGNFDRALDCRLVARDDDLAAAIVVRGLADLALRRFRRDRGRLLELERPRVRNSRAASGTVNAPAAASAEYSPSE
jgi:hypothetical protein